MGTGKTRIAIVIALNALVLVASQQTSSCRGIEGVTQCSSFRGEDYCFQSWGSPLNQQCVDGICECNHPNYDRCTCLPKIDGCVIEIGADDAAATHLFRGRPSSGGYKVYSCRGDDRGNEVHVIGNYEGNGIHGFRIHNTGTTQFNIHGRGFGNPIILVLNSYEPINWVLNFSEPDVVIAKVVLIAYHLDKSDVTYDYGRVQEVERIRDGPQGYGTGSDTVELIRYVTRRFGPLTSFTGTYQADQWDLTLESGPEPTTAAPVSGSVSCGFEDETICGYSQDVDDEFDWNRRTGYSGLFGPSQSSTYRDGFYMLASAGGGNIPSSPSGDFAEARLSSPEYTTTSSAQCLKFYYHCATSGRGPRRSRLRVYAKSGGRLGIPVWERPRCNQRRWHLAEVDISSEVGDSYQVVFETVHSGWPYTSMGIDDVTFREGSCSGVVPTPEPTATNHRQLTCYCTDCNSRNRTCVTDGSCFGEKVVVGRREKYSFRCLDKATVDANPFLCRQLPGRSAYQTTTVCCNTGDLCNYHLITNPQGRTTARPISTTTKAPTAPPVVKPGTCPVPGEAGICVDMCQYDRDCPDRTKCCSNGCGHVCVLPLEEDPGEKEGTCPASEGGGDIFRCRQECESDFDCTGAKKCCRDGCNIVCRDPAPIVPVEKDGKCPAFGGGSGGRCRQECESDQDCSGRKKCCLNGCNVVCVDPVPGVPTEPEYEICWSGAMCNDCDRDWVGSVNGLDVCCPQCRQTGLRIIGRNCTCIKDWSPGNGDDDEDDEDDSEEEIFRDRWTRRNFMYDDTYNSCNGDQLVKLSGYDVGMYVGVILCSPTRYKIFLSDDLDDVFLNVADSSGHGQDHCEFLGGTAESRSIDNDFWDSPLTRGYYRSRWGEAPRLASIGGGIGNTWTGKFYVRWIECGLTIP